MTTATRRAYSGSRGKFSIQDDYNPSDLISQKCEDEAKLVKYIDDNIIGKSSSFLGPFGRRKVVFCDYNGSGRSLQFLEDYIQKEVLPTHGGTCSSMSNTSLQSNLYKEEARSVIHGSCNCSQEDVVLLGGSLSLLVRTLRPRSPVVFVGPSESAATLAPWNECGSTIIRIPETKEGFLDLNTLELKLQQFSSCGRRLIGCFAAASRVTGILADDVATTLLLHQYGALAVWGCTLSAGGRGLDMNPLVQGLEEGGIAARKDAAFFTCAKYVGGVQAPSVLIVKKSLYKQNPMFSCDDVQDIIMKEEDCGSVEAVRAGLVVQLKDAIGQRSIEARQNHITRQVLSHIKNLPELIVLGNDIPSMRRLPIFSLLIKHPRGAFLHHNFVCAVLNDVFGIQARGGLKSTTNYGQELLGIDENLGKEYAKLLGDDPRSQLDYQNIANSLPHYHEHLRPGFFRISLPYFISDGELAFVLEALKMVATEAWKILPQYTVNPETGIWTHHTFPPMRDRKLIKSIRYNDGKMCTSERKFSGNGTFPQTYYECLQTARNLFSRARKSAQKCPLTEQHIKFNARADYLRWYMLPKEAHDLLLGNSTNVKHIIPFDPAMYNSGRKSVTASSGHNSPIPGGSPRHYSLSAIDTNQFSIFNSMYRPLSREPSLTEQSIKPKLDNVQSSPVKFVIGDIVTTSTYSNVPVSNLIRAENRLSRARCHSLGSDSPPIVNTDNINAIKPNLGTNNSRVGKLDTCNCGSQTDLPSLEDFNNSPSSSFGFLRNNVSNTDFNQLGRASPAVSVTSQTSEDLQAYVKEMTKEIATELKSEIREVISRVEDVLENTDSIDISCLNFNNNPAAALPDRNSVSVSDVTEYLMGVSREMASEVKHEIREMVNQVDEMISPDINSSNSSLCISSSPNSSRKSSPPDAIRRRYRSGSEVSFVRMKSATLGNENVNDSRTLKKSPTSPGFSTIIGSSQVFQEEDNSTFFRGQQKTSLPSTSSLSPQRTPDSLSHDILSTGNLSFNSSETSSPDTIIQVLSATTNTNLLPKSSSSHKLSDDDNSCTESDCQRLCYKTKTCYHNNSVSSQDSGINMSFHDHDGCHDLVKRRPHSDTTCYKKKRTQSRLKSACVMQRQEKSEVPDIIEGVPVCSGEHKSHFKKPHYHESESSHDCGRCQEFESRDEKSSCSTSDSMSAKHTNRTSTVSSLDPTDYSRKSSFNTDSYSSNRSSLVTTTDDFARCSDPSCCHLESATDVTTTSNMCRSRLSSHSSSSTEYPDDFVFEDDGKWHCPPKSVWKGTIEAVQEYTMIRHQDKILVCLSGGVHSLTLLHTLHQYQFYARAKGIIFSIGAITINDGHSDTDPLHLMAYCKTLGIKYIYQDNSFSGPPQNTSLSRTVRDRDLCSFTNHWIRRQIYRSANEHGYNVVATGQHLDDVARSFIMSVFNNGRLKSMKAHYMIREQNLRVIRPFVYVREKSLTQFADSCHLPSFTSYHIGDQSSESFINLLDEATCSNASENNENRNSSEPISSSTSKVNRSLSAPADANKQKKEHSGRTRATSAPCVPPTTLLAHQEALHPGLFANIKSALHPLISARNIEKDMKEYRHRKRSVIQMKNGVPVYNSDEGTDEEPVP